MEIFQRPGEILVLTRAASAVAAGAGAGIGAEEFRGRIRALGRRCGKNQGNGNPVINCFTHGFKFVNGMEA